MPNRSIKARRGGTDAAGENLDRQALARFDVKLVVTADQGLDDPPAAAGLDRSPPLEPSHPEA